MMAISEKPNPQCKRIIFEDIPHGAFAIYDSVPTMFLDDNKSPKLYTNEIPPQHEISKRVFCTFEELNSTILVISQKNMKEEIKSIAKCFLEGGMNTVNVGLYPLISIVDGDIDVQIEKCPMTLVMGYCMVAY